MIRFEHLSEAQKRASPIADNQLAAQAGWDDALLAEELAWLRDERFDLDLVGFDATELERLLAIPVGTRKIKVRLDVGQVSGATSWARWWVRRT